MNQGNHDVHTIKTNCFSNAALAARAWTAVMAIMLVAMAAMLSACGGGTVSQAAQVAAGDTVTTTYAMTVQLTDASGVPGSYFSAGATVDVIANVTQTVKTTDPAGNTSIKTSPAVAAIVQFTSPGGSFNPSTGNVLTDANGKAAIILTLGQIAGAYSVNAVTQGNAAGATAQANYLIQSAAVPTLSLSLLNQQGQPISTMQAGAIGQVSIIAQELMQTVGQSGGSYTPAQGIPVTVSSDGGTFDPSSGVVLTDANGKATLNFMANSTLGAFTLSASASIQGNTTTTTSNFAVVAPPLVMGSGTPFQAGVVQISPSSIQDGGTATATVELTDGQGHPFALPVSVTFTSTCAQAGKATLTSPVPAVNGVATSAYTPGSGCLGQDQIQAQVTLTGQTIPTTASGNITVTTPPATGLVFDSATPSNIALAGHGTGTHPERSTVTFTVVSANGVAVPGQKVDFALSSLAGGTSLVTTMATSDNAGTVTTVIQSGNIPSTVTVEATLAGGGGSAVSGGVVISSGAPEQSGFSLSATQLNLEAFNYDGETTQLTIRAADHYSNPVPDGTAVSFTADGGSVSPSCTTSGGACTVTLTSQNPRPSNGRVVVLATTPGDETFKDDNGNGLWDTGEPFQALPEPWRDDNENGKYDPGEFFIDVNHNGIWDAADNTYRGSLCNPQANPPCDPNGTYVRQQMVIVFATQQARIGINPGTINVNNVSPANVSIAISDLNGNLPPANSKVQITVSAGKLLTNAAYTIGDSDSRGPLVLNAQVVGDGTTNAGVLTVTVTTPKGFVTTAQASINQAVQQQTPSSITLMPATISIGANQTTTVQTQAVVNTTTPPAGPLAGVIPVVNCLLGTSSGLTLTPPTSVQPTGTNGSTVIAVNAVTGATPSGQATCTVAAGTVSATLTISAGP